MLWRSLVSWVCLTEVLLLAPLPLQAVQKPPEKPGIQRSGPQRYVCPAEFESLVQLMLRDLPGYANRVMLRSVRRQAGASLNYVVTAGRPEFEPLPLAPQAANPAAAMPADVRQVFLTTLERQHTAGKVIEVQQFHWVFLTQSPSGWRLALLFTRIGARKNPITPPRESSQGTIGQAMQTWLRDCQAGAVKPSPPDGGL